MTQKLPLDFVARGLELAETANLFGVPLVDLSRDELLAAAAQGWAAYNKNLQDSIRGRELLREMRGPSRG